MKTLSLEVLWVLNMKINIKVTWKAEAGEPEYNGIIYSTNSSQQHQILELEGSLKII